MDEPSYTFKPTGQISVFNLKPDYNIRFHNNSKEVGKLDFNGPKLVFTGDAEESAKVFIDWIARSFAGRLEEERKAEREACLNCYSPDDTATDWADKIRARGNS